MPRNRSARLAVLGAAVPRSRPVSYSSRQASALRRRIVAGVLVLLSLALITIYFREPASGGLHRVQSVGASVLRPFEVGAERVARPFRDAYGYFAGLANARSQNRKLRAENQRLNQQLIQYGSAAQDNAVLRKLLRYRDSAAFPKGYGAVTARVIVQPTDFEQQIVIAAGSSSGIHAQEPVVTADGLVGEVARVGSDTALVTLLTDGSSNVSVLDLQTRAWGILHLGQHGTLSVDHVTTDQVVNKDDQVITAGWPSGRLASIYPRGIPVGTVTSVGQVDVNPVKQIQIQPFVDFSSLDSVLVLVPKKPLPKLP